jgi:hypothetical protein
MQNIQILKMMQKHKKPAKLSRNIGPIVSRSEQNLEFLSAESSIDAPKSAAQGGVSVRNRSGNQELLRFNPYHQTAEAESQKLQGACQSFYSPFTTASVRSHREKNAESTDCIYVKNL